MKRIISSLTLCAFMLTLAAGLSFSQQTDITGTWVGQTDVPDVPEPDKLTIVITKKEGKYAITFTDTLGYADNTECKDIEYKENELAFNFEISDGYSTETIYVTLTVTGDTMKGYWENEEGNSAEIVMERKK